MTLSFSKRHIVLTKWKTSGEHNGKVGCSFRMGPIIVVVGIWRIRNPEIKSFTWRQKSPLIQRRLDYWLISDVCQEDIEKSDIISSFN